MCAADWVPMFVTVKETSLAQGVSSLAQRAKLIAQRVTSAAHRVICLAQMVTSGAVVNLLVGVN
jgi:hypothetical protein